MEIPRFSPGLKIPGDVPKRARFVYEENYRTITHGRDRLMLFAGDQKVEHLNDDFHGPGISPDDNTPEHLFRIAGTARIGVFATQLGLVARYGADYPSIPYLIKLNSRTNLVKTQTQDPFSAQWLDVDTVVEFREETGLHIAGVGYTVYLGSEYEPEMLHEAARIVTRAHANGLVTVLWMYPRGKSVANEKDSHLIAGAAGVGAALGSDFVKVNPPAGEGADSAELLREAVEAAGRTRLVCSGGTLADERIFLATLYDQIHIGGASGNATGRNIHQRPFMEAVRFANAIYAITVEDASVEEAARILVGEDQAEAVERQFQ